MLDQYKPIHTNTYRSRRVLRVRRPRRPRPRGWRPRGHRRPRGATAHGPGVRRRPRTRIMDSDFKLGFKFWVTVTVTARFKFLAVSRDGHAGTSLRVRGLGSRMDSDRAPRCGPDGSFHRGSHCSTWSTSCPARRRQALATVPVWPGPADGRQCNLKIWMTSDDGRAAAADSVA